MRIPDPYIHLDVDYSAAETKAEGEVGLSFQIRDLFAIGFAFGIPVLKWLLRWKKEKKLREEVAEENFAAGFALGWEIRKELQDAGVLSALGGEDSGTVIPERK